MGDLAEVSEKTPNCDDQIDVGKNHEPVNTLLMFCLELASNSWLRKFFASSPDIDSLTPELKLDKLSDFCEMSPKT